MYNNNVDKTRQLIEQTQKFINEGVKTVKSESSTVITESVYGKLMLESHGFKNVDGLFEAAINKKISDKVFNRILDGYFNILNEEDSTGMGVASKVLSVMQKIVDSIKNRTLKASVAVMSMINKSVTFIFKFKEKHPVLFWIIVASAVLIIYMLLSSSASAEVRDRFGPSHGFDPKNPNPSNYPTPEYSVSETIGFLDKWKNSIKPVNANDSSLVDLLGNLQNALAKAKDNPNVVLDLKQPGAFRDAYEQAVTIFRDTYESLGKTGHQIPGFDKGNTYEMAKYINTLRDAGRAFIAK